MHTTKQIERYHGFMGPWGSAVFIKTRHDVEDRKKTESRGVWEYDSDNWV